jgi:hypothetical protein
MTDTIPADFETIAEIARRMKRECVLEFGNDPDEELSDLRSFVIVVRNGRQVALIFVGAGPDATRHTCYAAAAIMRPHEIFLVADARMRTYAPEAGMPDVRHGEYQEDWQAGRREGITEAIVVQRMPVIGEATMASYPYVRNGTQLRWLKHGGPLKSPSGTVINATRQGYANARKSWPQLEAVLNLSGEYTEMSKASQEHHTDRACARFLSSQTDAVVTLFDANVFDADVTFIDGEEVRI